MIFWVNEDSVKWVNENQGEAGRSLKNTVFLPNAKLAEKAIPKCNIVFLGGERSFQSSMNEFLKILPWASNPASGRRGELPGEDFYYIKK